MLQRYQALNAEQQQVAAKKMQEEQHRKEQEAMEKQEKDQRAAAEQSDDVVVPQGRPRGEDAAMGSGKKRTVTKLQNDRKKLSSAG